MKKQYRTLLVIIILITVLVIDREGYINISEQTTDMYIDIIDVGQGDSILLRFPESKTLLIDGGSPNTSVYIEEHLSKHNITKIDYALATHPHLDHIGSLDDIIIKYKPDTVFLSERTHTTVAYENLLNSIIHSRATAVKVEYDKPISIPLEIEKLEVTILPASRYYESINNSSLVVLVKYGTTKMLFMADAEGYIEEDLLRDYGSNIDIDLLKVGHHGSVTSTTPRFLLVATPEISVISVGANNDYGHPHDEVLNRLIDKSKKVYRTDIDGTVTIKANGSKLTYMKGD